MEIDMSDFIFPIIDQDRFKIRLTQTLFFNKYKDIYLGRPITRHFINNCYFGLSYAINFSSLLNENYSLINQTLNINQTNEKFSLSINGL